MHFIGEFDQYFSLRQTPEELFRKIKQPVAKQWLFSVFDKLKRYDEFKKAFTELKSSDHY